MKLKYDTYAEDIRRLAPDFAHAVGAALARQLPVKGSVRSPNGLVHEIIGDYTVCHIQWAAYSSRQGMSIKVVDWEPCPDAPSCLECVVDA